MARLTAASGDLAPRLSESTAAADGVDGGRGGPRRGRRGARGGGARLPSPGEATPLGLPGSLGASNMDSADATGDTGVVIDEAAEPAADAEEDPAKASPRVLGAAGTGGDLALLNDDDDDA